MTFTRFVQIICLLWTINFAPPFLAYYLDKKWSFPLDGGLRFLDGHPLFGPHKTVRGIAAAILAGGLSSVFFELPIATGLMAGVLSMVGDLMSSFIKRRFALASGKNVPVIDQVFEGTLPLAYLISGLGLAGWWLLPLLLTFCLGAYTGSFLYKEILSVVPAGYPRTPSPRLRMKEIASCNPSMVQFRYLFHFEEAVYYHIVIRSVMRMLCLYERGKANALELRTRRLTLSFPGLPPSFEGYTILFLSDLHLDGLAGLPDRIQEIVRDEPVDLCLLGGDYRMATHGPYTTPLVQLGRLAAGIRAKDGIYGVLGNHDCLEMIEPLREMHVEVLLNDAVALERGGSRIWVAGVDDPHYYQCSSVEAACGDLPEGEFRILLAHSPEVHADAERHGVDLYLCGHTHAGQIQLPSHGPIFTHSRSPRSLSQGLWRQGSMVGYTSSGVGVSGVPVRFFTQGEVVFLTLSGKTEAEETKGTGTGEAACPDPV